MGIKLGEGGTLPGWLLCVRLQGLLGPPLLRAVFSHRPGLISK